MVMNDPAIFKVRLLNFLFVKISVVFGFQIGLFIKLNKTDTFLKKIWQAVSGYKGVYFIVKVGID